MDFASRHDCRKHCTSKAIRFLILGAIPILFAWGPLAIVEAQPTGRKIYVANYASDSLGVFPINANGNLLSLTKFGVDNEIVAPSGVALDAKGKIYVANDGVATGHPESDSVRIYPAGSNAIAAPIGGGSNYSSPQAIAVGSDGTSYVVNGTGDISIFGPGADGKLRMRTIVNGLDDPSGLAVDHDGNLYVVNGGSQSITVYGPDADGETPPIRTISGEKTRLNLPQGIALDTAGKIYVTNDGEVPDTHNQSPSILPVAVAMWRRLLSSADREPISNSRKESPSMPMERSTSPMMAISKIPHRMPLDMIKGHAPTLLMPSRCMRPTATAMLRRSRGSMDR